MSEDGFREIQLSGKQLVFLFMATTVVAVVIFLCGVMVGRGVRAEAASETEAQIADLSTQPAAPPAEVTPATPQPKVDTSAPPPQPVNDELSYYNRLEKQGTPAEALKTPGGAAAEPEPAAATLKAAAPSTATAAPKSPAPAPPAQPAALKSTPSTPSTPSTSSTSSTRSTPAAATKRVTPPPAAAESAAAGEQSGFAVQVAALGSKSDAAALAQRLTGKGYDAYVVTPPPGGGSVYRVRVGRFKSRQEADATARRLEKEEKFKPWVIR